MLNWEEVYRSHQEGVLPEVARVKAHLSKKKKQEMTLLEHSVTEGNEKGRGKLAKDGALLDGGDVAQVRASTVLQKKREEVYAVLQVEE